MTNYGFSDWLNSGVESLIFVCRIGLLSTQVPGFGTFLSQKLFIYLVNVFSGLRRRLDVRNLPGLRPLSRDVKRNLATVAQVTLVAHLQAISNALDKEVAWPM